MAFQKNPQIFVLSVWRMVDGEIMSQNKEKIRKIPLGAKCGDCRSFGKTCEHKNSPDRGKARPNDKHCGLWKPK